MRFETRAIHAGQDPDPRTGAVNIPIYASTTFVQDGVGQHRGWDYGRSGNPTRDALEAALASLEEAEDAVTFASGLAAEDAVFRLLEPGDHVIIADDVYGGTWRQLDKVHVPAGLLEVTAVDLSDLDQVRDALTDRTRVVWIETPSNPLLKVLDIAALADLAHEAGARLAVDNTFATPWLTQPLSLGADIVVHSTTKYLGGHSDVVGGAVCTDAATCERLRFLQNAVGAVGSPFDNYLTLRGMRTLGVRMRAHCANAHTIAEHLEQHPGVSEVFHPGLASHPNHDVARRQMRDFGGMVSVRIAGGREAADRVATGTELFFLAESLGGVESLIEHPGAMTHASVAGTQLEVPDDLLRLSVGIEDVEDLVADLDAALATVA